MDCIFCSIINGETESKKVYEDERVIAFNDISPVAPVHILVLPKTHIQDLNDTNAPQCMADIFAAIPTIAKQAGLENGYRVITNVGKDGGQAVPHLHFHLLGGKQLSWTKY